MKVTRGGGRPWKVESSVLCLQRDIEELGKKIEAVGDDVSLIVVDPLNAYFGDKIDTHQTAPVRAVLARLDGFATSTTSPSLASCTRRRQSRA